MKNNLALLLVLVFSVFASFSHASGEEKYFEVDPSELKFTYEGECAGVALTAEGYISTGCVVVIFQLEGKDVELLDRKITRDSFIQTKNFGKIKLTYSSNMATSIWLTPSQRKKFKSHLGKN